MGWTEESSSCFDVPDNEFIRDLSVPRENKRDIDWLRQRTLHWSGPIRSNRFIREENVRRVIVINRRNSRMRMPLRWEKNIYLTYSECFLLRGIRELLPDKLNDYWIRVIIVLLLRCSASIYFLGTFRISDESNDVWSMTWKSALSFDLSRCSSASSFSNSIWVQHSCRWDSPVTGGICAMI